jgi:hypothetical protein
MDKHEIIRELKRIAQQNGGKPPGKNAFARLSGIKEHEWYPRIWLRWSEAVEEAGFRANEWTQKRDDKSVLAKYVELIRELGHVPVRGEIRRKGMEDDEFPGEKSFSRFGGKNDLVNAVLLFCDQNAGYEDVSELYERYSAALPDNKSASPGKVSIGFVYLMKSGRHYKIGRSNSVGRREWELGIKIPIPPKVIHSIATDDPVGVEAYWHKRYADKRGEGEWFDLSSDDISAFKRWKKIS